MKFTFWANEENFYEWENESFAEWSRPEVFVAINSSLKIARLDPDLVVLKISNELDFIGDFRLYKMTNASAIRPASVRVLYDRTRHLLYYLDGTYQPVYNAWNIAIQARKCPYINKANAISYVKFFFDNVATENGRFELIDNLNHLKNRVNNHWLIKRCTYWRTTYTANFWDEALRMYFRTHKVSITENEGQITVSNMLMIIHNTLFKADIKIDINQDGNKYGAIEFNNEYYACLVQDSTVGFTVRFSPVGNNQPPEASEIPFFEF